MLQIAKIGANNTRTVKYQLYIPDEAFGLNRRVVHHEEVC